MSTDGRWRRHFRLTETPRHVREQVDDELSYHVETLVERHVAEGMSEEEAWEAVRNRFDDLERTRAEMTVRKRRGVKKERWRYFRDVLRADLRVSLRQARRRPGFTALAVTTLGLGIGASTTMFSVVSGVLLDPLPYPESDRLVYVGTVRRGERVSNTTAPEFLALRARTQALESYTAFQHATLNALIGEQPEQLTAAEVTEDYFQVFGLTPVLGRAFFREDYGDGASPVVLLSHRVWQQQWGGDPRVLGTVITTSRRSSPAPLAHTIVGVMPPTFPSPADLWMPIRLAGTHWEHEEWRFGNFVFTSIGRLRPGRQVEDVQAEATGVASLLADQHPRHYSGRFYEGRSLGVVPLLDRMVIDYRSSILLLFGAATVLLIIAIANLTGLLLTRLLDRRHEIALRSALGAGRGRIFRHLVTETTSLSLIGGGVGLAIAVGGTRVLRAFAPAGFPRIDNLQPDVRVAAFAVVIALACGLLCGTVPLISTTRVLPVSCLRGLGWAGGRESAAGLRGFLVSVQTALAVSLLVGAGLVSNSLLKLQEVEPGIEVEGLLVMPIRLPGSYDTAERHGAFFGDAARRISSIPGVESASWIPDPPMYGRNMSSSIRTEETDEDEAPLIGIHPVGPDYFATTGIPVLNGRGITWTDDAGNVPVAVVDEVMADQFWPAENPVGRQLFTRETRFTVVGVVGRIRQATLGREAQPEVYVSAFQHTPRFSLMRMVIRSQVPLGDLAPLLRSAVWEVDPTLPVPTIETMGDRITADLRDPRFHTFLLSTFSLTAVILTLAGIYSLMLHWVTARTQEIGLRTALGARPGSVLWTISRQCLLLVLVGLIAGLGLAVASSRFLSAFLFGVSPLDLHTFVLVGAALGMTALLACMLPALRATRVDPTTALRWE